MTEKQALILLFLGAIVAVFAVLAGIKLLGGDEELMAIGGMVVLCVSAWESAGVVMRYSDKDNRH